MQVKDRIIKQILKNKNGIRLDKFINEALYKKNSYYTDSRPIGAHNDFITSPEISQMFGEIIGLYILNYWLDNLSSNFNLIELGPGNGKLLKDIIRVSNIRKDFIKKSNIFLIENNKKLIKIQKKTTKQLGIKKVKWLNKFNLNSKLPSIIYANEFLDCLPIRQFYKKIYWMEKYINYDSQRSDFFFDDKKVFDKNLLSILRKFEDNNVAEISKARVNIFNKICLFIKKNKGIIILVDYGYEFPIKNFTLQTVYNHKKTHLFDNVGNQDITSLVNFSELKNIALKHGLIINEFCNQKKFLIKYGINIRKEILSKNIKNKKIIDKQYDKLTNFNYMGKIFKFLIVSSK